MRHKFFITVTYFKISNKIIPNEIFNKSKENLEKFMRKCLDTLGGSFNKSMRKIAENLGSFL